MPPKGRVKPAPKAPKRKSYGTIQTRTIPEHSLPATLSSSSFERILRILRNDGGGDCEGNDHRPPPNAKERWVIRGLALFSLIMLVNALFPHRVDHLPGGDELRNGIKEAERAGDVAGASRRNDHNYNDTSINVEPSAPAATSADSINASLTAGMDSGRGNTGDDPVDEPYANAADEHDDGNETNVNDEVLGVELPGRDRDATEDSETTGVREAIGSTGGLERLLSEPKPEHDNEDDRAVAPKRRRKRNRISWRGG